MSVPDWMRVLLAVFVFVEHLVEVVLRPAKEVSPLVILGNGQHHLMQTLPRRRLGLLEK